MKLHKLLSEKQSLEKNIYDREESLLRLSDELAFIEDEVGREKEKEQQILQSNALHESCPQVMEYVRQKALIHELEIEIKSWKRKGTNHSPPPSFGNQW